MNLLDKINSPTDLKKLKIKELEELTNEIRKKIIEVTAKNGGHVAPNLGVVELTLALHYVFNAPKDKIIWDVGHQCYTHKLITGRRKLFHTLRKKGGISGFPKREESPYDVFGTGHAGTSLSAAFGLATARDILGEDYNVIAVIGDGSLISGMALEALNHIGASGKDLIIVLNDNGMSIAKNPGAIALYLNRIITMPFYKRLRAKVWNALGKLPSGKREKARKIARMIEKRAKGFLIPGLWFEELGFHYFGPLNGHDLKGLISFFKRIEDIHGPILVHVLTKKGYGFEIAQKNPELFHGVGPFDLKSFGIIKKDNKKSFSAFFGDTLVEFAEKDKRIVAITAAMCLGTGLLKFREKFPDRFFDMGITEEHCATFAAGLTLRGLKPVFAIYSTFLQRAFDQVIHDIALQKLPVIFCIDRAGLVGEDGPTHHGTFDVSYLRFIPNFVISAPKDEDELRDLLYTALHYQKAPFAIRYPRSVVVGVQVKEKPKIINIGEWEILREGKDVCILAMGSMVYPSLDASKILGKNGISAAVINARFIKPMDEKLLEKISKRFKKIVTVEENAIKGGFGSAVLEFFEQRKIKKDVLRIGIPDRFIEHGPRDRLLYEIGLTKEGISERVKMFL